MTFLGFEQYGKIRNYGNYCDFVATVILVCNCDDLTDTDLCPCGETQTMFHIIESFLPSYQTDDTAVAWLTNYGS